MAATFSKLSLITFSLTLHLLCSTASPATATSATTKPKRLVTKLIHHDSTLSPYHDPNATTADLFSRAMKSSLARYKYLEGKSRSSTFHQDDTRAGVVAESSATPIGFLANFSFGEPPVPHLMVMDTGSSLLWIQCLPCTKCFKQSYPIFDPAKSSTYKPLPCTSPQCTYRYPCDHATNNCKFNLRYVDGTISEGILATEKLTLETSDEGLSPIDNVVFGCAHNTTPLVGDNPQVSGILGLGASKLSLTTYLGSKFSYCLGSIRDPQYPYNQLILGDGTVIEGSPTPLDVFGEHYYLTLEGISVGQTLLPIDKQVFVRSPSGGGGTLIDTGATFTILAKPAYDALSAEVQRLADPLLERVSVPDLLCYKGTIDRDLRGFPDVTFHLAGEVDLALDTMSLFSENGPNVVCMAVESAKDKGFSVIGILAQQSYNVAYDIGASKVYFQYIDCSLLEDRKVN